MNGGSRRSRRLLAALVVAAVLIAPSTACSDEGADAGPVAADGGPGTTAASTIASTAPSQADGPPATTTVTDPAPVAAFGTHAVGRSRLDLVDESRDTEENLSAPASDGRALPTSVFYPAVGETPDDPLTPTITDDADPLDGRYPLVVFSHGLTGQAAFYQGFLAGFASAGYVVVAPDHPLSWTGAPGGATVSDVGNQPGDVSFLIDAFTADDPAGPTAAFTSLVDPERIAAAGHSLGAITALGAGFGLDRADPRLDAVAAWAGTAVLLGDGADPATADRPVLLVHGTADETVPYDRSATTFGLLTGPRWFVTLSDAGHIEPYLALASSERSELVGRATLAFLDAHLKGAAGLTPALEGLVGDAGPGIATLETAGT